MNDGNRQLHQGELRELAKEHGLSVFGLASLEPLASDLESLRSWQAQGYAADMGYMKRPPELLTAPLQLLGTARSIVVFAIRYEAMKAPILPPGHGRIARYAWGRDYHRVLKKLLKRLVKSLGEKLGREVIGRPFSDAVPLLERALARGAGIGFIGKNSMLIRPKLGSLFFLAEVLLDISFVNEVDVRPITGTCGSCNRCQVACPTGALVSDRVLDARKCISYLTIEKVGVLSDWEKGALGEWVFGCDICQEVCPFNYSSLKAAVRADLEELQAHQGAGPVLSLESVLRIRCKKEFESRFGGTPLMRPGREGLLRNAATVAGNLRCKELRSVLELSLQDDSEVVREHAKWALERI